MKSSIKPKVIAFALVAATAGIVLAYPMRPAVIAPGQPLATPSQPSVNAAKGRPKVEVVFVLDTTGSMGGLIQAAKDNIWSIASSMASAQPAPEIRMGLVAFRDRGDQYVTRVVDLSTDLDSMYSTLMELRADGGGDGPESVNQALHDAVHRVSWSQDKDSYKVVFLVGDAPPHMDYPDDVKYPDTIKAARARGIVVNTIQAGSDPSTRTEWQQIAQLNQGEYFQVGQSGSAVAVATPFDEKLAALSHELDDTRLFYGDADKRRELAAKQAASDKVHAEGSVASRAKRATFNASAAGEKNLLADSELVDDVKSGRVDLAKVESANLPAPLRGLSKADQAKVIEETAGRRAELRSQIDTLSRERQAFIAGELKKSGTEKDSFDYRIHEAVKEQAAAKGLKYEAKPVY